MKGQVGNAWWLTGQLISVTALFVLPWYPDCMWNETAGKVEDCPSGPCCQKCHDQRVDSGQSGRFRIGEVFFIHAYCYAHDFLELLRNRYMLIPCRLIDFIIFKVSSRSFHYSSHTYIHTHTLAILFFMSRDSLDIKCIDINPFVHNIQIPPLISDRVGAMTTTRPYFRRCGQLPRPWGPSPSTTSPTSGPLGWSYGKHLPWGRRLTNVRSLHAISNYSFRNVRFICHVAYLVLRSNTSFGRTRKPLEGPHTSSVKPQECQGLI